VDAFQLAMRSSKRRSDRGGRSGGAAFRFVAAQAACPALRLRRRTCISKAREPGDELIATVTAREKKPKAPLSCSTAAFVSDGRELVTGTVTVRAPEHRLQFKDLATPQVILGVLTSMPS